jgi:hypothetical protein
MEALERMVVRQQEALEQHALLIHRLRMEILALPLLNPGPRRKLTEE